jgi:hypothetical protein
MPKILTNQNINTLRNHAAAHNRWFRVFEITNCSECGGALNYKMYTENFEHTRECPSHWLNLEGFPRS